MTQHWRSTDPESPTASWLRGRWPEGSLYVLDIDNLICDPTGDHGLLIEWKHVDAPNRDWRITRKLGRRLGWWSALFVYETRGLEVLWIDATFCGPDGKLSEPMDLAKTTFDEWVLETFGRRG